MSEYTHFLRGEIDGQTGHDLTLWLTRLRIECDKQQSHQYRVTIVIDSPGGSVVAALAIVDAMDMLKTLTNVELRTVGTGIVASAAVSIFVNGTPDSRILTPRAIVLTHNLSYGFPPGQSTHHHVRDTWKTFNIMREAMVDVYHKNLKGTSRKVIRDKYLSNDYTFNATLAQSMNFADHVRADYLK